jgi:hypothetical protein
MPSIQTPAVTESTPTSQEPAAPPKRISRFKAARLGNRLP